LDCFWAVGQLEIQNQIAVAIDLGHCLKRQASRPEIQEYAAVVVVKFHADNRASFLPNVTATFHGRGGLLRNHRNHNFLLFHNRERHFP
jgi:hypothetical protein